MRTIFCIIVIMTGFISSCTSEEINGPYFATGIKIGEVDQNHAIVWVRLTDSIARVGKEAPMPDVKYKDPETGEFVERKKGKRPNIAPVVLADSTPKCN